MTSTTRRPSGLSVAATMSVGVQLSGRPACLNRRHATSWGRTIERPCQLSYPMMWHAAYSNKLVSHLIVPPPTLWLPLTSPKVVLWLTSPDPDSTTSINANSLPTCTARLFILDIPTGVICSLQYENYFPTNSSTCSRPTYLK